MNYKPEVPKCSVEIPDKIAQIQLSRKSGLSTSSLQKKL